MIIKWPNRINLFALVGLFFVVLSCSTHENITNTQESAENSKYYDTEFPGNGLPDELEYISKTVKKLDCIAFYMTYVFPPGNEISAKGITDSILLLQSVNKTVNNESVSGTAMVIYNDGAKLCLLTCAHIINFPDTLITRYDNGEGAIQTVSVKIKQQNFIRDLPAGSEISVLAIDEDSDIAIIGKTIEKNNPAQAVLNYPEGNTRDLQWGSVVYVMGYPIGNLMVTRAIVSNPGRAEKGRFLTDALYNRGISGSPVLAIRGGIPHFELVGMASSAAAKQLYYVKPGKDQPDYINPEVPFTGDLYADHYKDIKYGVTYNVTIESIMKFLKENQEVLKANGYNKEQFFK